jgi:hypothetical protein
MNPGSPQRKVCLLTTLAGEKEVKRPREEKLLVSKYEPHHKVEENQMGEIR